MITFKNNEKYIGKGGSKLKDLKTETKTNIIIPGADEKTNEITVKGRAEGVEIARKKILQASASTVSYHLSRGIFQGSFSRKSFEFFVLFFWSGIIRRCLLFNRLHTEMKIM